MNSLSLIKQFAVLGDELIKLFASIILGGLIGWQREYTGHEAGIRAFSSICMGSCLFGILSYSVASGDPGRIAAQVVSGISFIGIGVVIRDGGSVKGLTTAATLWSMSAIGLAIAFDLFIISVIATLLIFGSLFLSQTKFWHYIAKRPGDYGRTNKVNYSVTGQKPQTDGPHGAFLHQESIPSLNGIAQQHMSEHCCQCHLTKQKS